MRLQLLIFLPGQINNHGIENGQSDQGPGMCAREAMQLVAHERTENDDRKRIGPEFVEPESDHQERLDYSMRAQIHGRTVRAELSEARLSSRDHDDSRSSCASFWMKCSRQSTGSGSRPVTRRINVRS